MTSNGVGTCGPDDNQAQAGHLIAEPGGTRTFQKVTRPASSDHPDVWEERDVAATLSPFDMGSDTRAVELVVGALTGRCGNSQDDQQTTQLITHALTSEGADASEDGTGRGTPLVVGVGLHGEMSGGTDGLARTVSGSHGQPGGVLDDVTVRRLTPLECERLQGFPDDWTAPQADAPRYRQMGNAVAVPVLEWVMRRVVAVDSRLAQIPRDGAVLNEHLEGVHEVGAEAVVTEVAGDGTSVRPERIGDADVA